MKSIAFIDCYMQSPVNKCVNSFILRTGLPCTYHMPSKFGLNTLASLEQVDGYIILGSTSHVTEKLPWHQELLGFIIPKIEAGVPTLGICFGHQLIADYYGCEVGYANTDKSKYTEVRDIKITQNEFGLTIDENLSLAFAHSQSVLSINDKFTTFAKSHVCKHEAIKLKGLNYWSFQAHPEASVKFIQEDAKVTQENTIAKTIQDSARVLDNFIAIL